MSRPPGPFLLHAVVARRCPGVEERVPCGGSFADAPDQTLVDPATQVRRRGDGAPTGRGHLGHKDATRLLPRRVPAVEQGDVRQPQHLACPEESCGPGHAAPLEGDDHVTPVGHPCLLQRAADLLQVRRELQHLVVG